MQFFQFKFKAYIFSVFKQGELISGTAQTLASLPPFPYLHKLLLWDIQEGFDLKTFNKFIKVR